MTEPKTAEEILKEITGHNIIMPFLRDGESIIIPVKQVYQAMEAFHQSKMVEDSEINSEAESRYPVETHSQPSNSPYLLSNKGFVYGARWMQNRIFNK